MDSTGDEYDLAGAWYGVDEGAMTAASVVEVASGVDCAKTV